MTQNNLGQLSLKICLDSLPKLIGTECSYYACLKRVGDHREKQKIVFPNGCSIICAYEELIEVAKFYNLPLSHSKMTHLLLEQNFDDPINFFRSRIIVVAMINGFGIVKVEPSDSKSFIGKVEMSYRGHRSKSS